MIDFHPNYREVNPQTYHCHCGRSLGKFLLVVVVAVEWPHEPVILEELHALPLLVHVPQYHLPLHQHLLLLQAVTATLTHELFSCSTVSALQNETV